LSSHFINLILFSSTVLGWIRTASSTVRLWQTTRNYTSSFRRSIYFACMS